MANKESGIQKLILDWLTIQGYYVWRNYVGAIIRRDQSFGKNPTRGMPDVMGLLKNGSGRLFAIEVKTDKGRIYPHQKERIAALNAHGGLAFIARDLETVIDRLAKEDLPPRMLH